MLHKPDAQDRYRTLEHPAPARQNQPPRRSNQFNPGTYLRPLLLLRKTNLHHRHLVGSAKIN
jgi:hypothetical protein